MGRPMLIICAGLLVALSYTFFGFASTREAMTTRNINSYEAAKAKNTAHTGIQIAIHRYNNDSSNDPDKYNEEFRYTETTDGSNLVLTIKESIETINGNNTEVATVTSTSTFNGPKHTVISTFDISKKQQLVPKFAGAISKVGNQSINFDKSGNSKVHFDGNPPDLPDGSPSPCESMPGLTVNNQNEVDQYEGSSNIEGDPPVGVEDSTKYQDVSDLIDELAPHAINVNDEDSFIDEPSIYFINDYTHLSGRTSGLGILVIRNNATLDVDNELFTSGKFRFDGLVILEDGSDFRGRGTADINGTIIAASNNSSSSIDTNGDFTARYDCIAQKYADDAVNKALNTTIYKRLSVYE